MKSIKVRETGEGGERVFKRAADDEDDDADISGAKKHKKKGRNGKLPSTTMMPKHEGKSSSTTLMPKHEGKSSSTTSMPKHEGTSSTPKMDDKTTAKPHSTSSPSNSADTTTTIPTSGPSKSPKSYSPEDFEEEILGKMERLITQWLGSLMRYGRMSPKGELVIKHVQYIKSKFYPSSPKNKVTGGARGRRVNPLPSWD